MLNYELNRAEGILILNPIGPLESTDFGKLVQEVDPYIMEKGKLNGLMIYANPSRVGIISRPSCPI